MRKNKRKSEENQINFYFIHIWRQQNATKIQKNEDKTGHEKYNRDTNIYMNKSRLSKTYSY